MRLYEQGWTRQRIADTAGVHRNAVGEWINAWQKNGDAGLIPKAKGRPKGSGMTLTAAQARRIRRIVVDRCPDQLKLPFALWTREAVQRLIRKEYGIAMPIRTVGEFLKRWNFTPRKPLK